MPKVSEKGATIQGDNITKTSVETPLDPGEEPVLDNSPAQKDEVTSEHAKYSCDK